MSVTAAPPRPSLLEEALPEFDVNEVHSRQIAASPEVVWDALRAIKPLEVRVLAPLLAMRALPALLTRRNFIRLNPSDSLLELFLGAGFIELGSRPGEEFAAGAIGRWWSVTRNKPVRIASPDEFVAFDEPGYARAAMNFTLAPAGDGTLARTETRIAGTDAEATKLFRRYWRVIYPGSALIRISWLNAIERRASAVT